MVRADRRPLRRVAVGVGKREDFLDQLFVIQVFWIDHDYGAGPVIGIVDPGRVI